MAEAAQPEYWVIAMPDDFGPTAYFTLDNKIGESCYVFGSDRHQAEKYTAEQMLKTALPPMCEWRPASDLIAIKHGEGSTKRPS